MTDTQERAMEQARTSIPDWLPPESKVRRIAAALLRERAEGMTFAGAWVEPLKWIDNQVEVKRLRREADELEQSV